MIIGVVGPIASGKSMLSDALVKKGFMKLSFSANVREEAKKRGILIGRKNLQDLGDEMRMTRGNDYWARLIIANIEPKKNYVVEGVRNLAEVEALRKLADFILVAVNAPIEKRYQWIMMRQKDSDPASIEEVKIIDSRDRGEGEAQHGQQSAACMALAEMTLTNDKTRKHFERKVEKLLKKMKIN